jgi:hypothetical protein
LASPTEDRPTVEAALETLLQGGFLELAYPLGPHDLDPLPSLIEFLEPFEGGAPQQCRERLRALAGHVGEYARSDAAGRRAALEGLRRELASVAEMVGVAPSLLLSLDLVREDVFVPGVSWTAGAAFREVLEREMCPLFEAMRLGCVQHSPAVLRFFVEQCGSGPFPNALALLARYGHHVHRLFAAGREAAQDDTAPALVAADRLLRRLNHEALARWAAEGGDVARVDPEWLPADLPDLRGWPGSVTVFFQVAAERPEDVDGGDCLLVLNVAQSGLGSYAARFCGLYGSAEESDPLTAMLRTHLAALSAGGRAEIVDMPYCADASDVQLHPRLTARDLAWPGEPREGDAVALSSLDLGHDAHRGALRLVERASGREVLPVYLGGIHPQLFPQPAPTVINNLTPTTYPYIREFWRSADVPAEAAARVDERAGVRHLPRVQIGRLVVARESWRVGAEGVPRPRPRESGASYHWRVHRWRHELGLPDLVYARAQIQSLQSAVGRKNKPMLVDFENPWTVFALPRLLLAEVSEIVFTEMLPGPSQLPVSVGGEAVASEWQVELNWRQP